MDWDLLLREHRAVVDCVGGALRPGIERAVAVVVDCIRAGGKVMTCGNGGSAADAQHLAAELVNRFLLNRRPYAALALTTDSSILTSCGNDFSFEQVFERQVQALARPGDVLVAFSTSGNSGNVVKAVEAARAAGVTVIGLLGGSGGRLQSLVDIALTVSCTAHTPRVQEGHLVILHALCERVEEDLARLAP